MKLYARLSGEYYSTSDNYLKDGSLQSLINGSTLTNLAGVGEVEYGIAPDWSVYARFGLVSSSLSAANGVQELSNSGAQDLHLSVKWNVKVTDPIVTLEVPLTMPLAQARPNNNGEIVLGDGSYDVGLILHTGQQSGAFLFALSPGMIFRSSGYPFAFTGDLAAQLDFLRGYIRAFGHGLFSLGNTTIPDSRSVGSTGTSYALQSPFPNGISAGGKIGLKLYNELFLEASVYHSVWGQQYPAGLGFTVGLFNAWDFFRPSETKKAKEVPFDSDPNDFYKGK
jgi:hypothetical protein